MSTSTPERRRALAPLDANRPSPAPQRAKSESRTKLPFTRNTSPLKPGLATPRAASASPVKARARVAAGHTARKRSLDMISEVESAPVVKKACVEVRGPLAETRRREIRPEVINVATPQREQSASPDASSVFDSSGLDTQPATVTEVELPDTTRRPRASREQARKMALDLKTRLRLAGYKVRTGQADVPFSQLEAESLQRKKREAARVPTVHVQRPSPPRASPHMTTQDDPDRSRGVEREEVPARESDAPYAVAAADSSVGRREEGTLPPLLASGMATPRRHGTARDEERLTSSVLRGGAVSGLLRLSQGGD